jgi:broad specificity phosphatase PhoE
VQARRFADWYGAADRVVASPQQRAVETAAELRGHTDVELHESLKEQSFGEWEGLLRSEMSASDRDVMRRIYFEGEDLPRGQTGETFAQLIERLSGFLADFELRAERTVVVSHGAAIKALVAGVLGSQVDIQSQLAVPANTSISHVAFPSDGPMLIDYAVAPHLEET